jgi:pimeloyl-ACP methyl ester carboxylesterase
MELVEQEVMTNGTRLHVYRTTTAKQPLVFAHGIMDDGLCFLPVAEQLADDFEIVLYDARGHGRSEASSPQTTLLVRARDLGGLVEALELQRPGLIGHSLGAVTVALCAGLFPELPGCVVLEDPPPLESLLQDSEQAAERWARWREWAEADKQRSVEELVQVSRERDPSWPEAERLPWARAKQRFDLTVFDEAPPDDLASLERIISHIACPALVLTADQDRGSLLPPTMAEELAARLPAGRHVNIPGAGHNIRREQPGRYVETVCEFLRASL